MNRLKSALVAIRSSLWFVPSIMVVASIGLALALVEVDQRYRFDLPDTLPLLFGAGAEGSRGMLSTIAGSMITIAGVTFSLTIAALATASTQYTSRVLRNFMRDRHNQLVLGCFVGIFTYCLVVLRTVRGEAEGLFVPSLAVFAALLLALLGIGVLVFFIHHIASSIQASTVIAAITDESLAVIERVFPSEGNDDLASERPLEAPPEFSGAHAWQPVRSPARGYVQNVDTAELVRIAAEHDTIVRLDAQPGAFAAEGSPLLSISQAGPVDDSMRVKLCACVSVERFRTIDQELGFGIRQLVDIALKALSPGVNDTTTAAMCIEHLGAVLAQLAPRAIPTCHRARDGRVRVITRGPSFADLTSAAFDEIRRNAAKNATVIERMMRAIGFIASRTGRRDRQVVLEHHLQLLADLADRTIDVAHDRAGVERALAAALQAVGSDRSASAALRAS
jgi:uncharacterized membrane protein